MSLNITAKQEITCTGKQVFVHCIYFLELNHASSQSASYFAFEGIDFHIH